MRALWLVAVALVGIAVFLWLDAREPRRRAPDRDGLIEETPPDRTGAGPDADREARLVVVGRDPDAADRLRLEVIDESGAPFPTEISLWRLGRDRDTWIGKRAAPWDANVGEGTYRAICLAARRDIPDPPPFLVRGRTHVRLVAPRPRDSEVLLRVYRADGRPVKRGLLAIRGRNRQVRDPQYALSGNRGFESIAALEHAMQKQRIALWPDGLVQPVADIPNRVPLKRSVNPVSGRAVEMRYLADVDNRFEPLNGTETPPVWSPDGPALVARAVAGLRQFLAISELSRIDRWLNAQPAADATLDAACDLDGAAFDEAGKVRINCTDSDVSLRGLLYRTTRDEPWRGRARLIVGESDLGNIELNAVAQNADVTLAASRKSDPLTIRLPDGRALGSMSLSGSHAIDRQATLTVRLHRDFERLVERVERLVQSKPALFGEGPFQRGALMPYLQAADTNAVTAAACCTQELPIANDTVATLDQLPPALLPQNVPGKARGEKFSEPK